MSETKKIPNLFLTVVIANDGPFIFQQEPIRHRTVRLSLTPEQLELLALRNVGTSCGKEIHESISQCFLEKRPK